MNDKAIYYDGRIITFKKISATKKGFMYYFNELPYGLNEEEFELTSLPLI